MVLEIRKWQKNELPLKSEALNPFLCQWLAWQNLLQPLLINPAENFKLPTCPDKFASPSSLHYCWSGQQHFL